MKVLKKLFRFIKEAFICRNCDAKFSKRVTVDVKPESGKLHYEYNRKEKDDLTTKE